MAIQGYKFGVKGYKFGELPPPIQGYKFGELSPLEGYNVNRKLYCIVSLRCRDIICV